MAGPSNYPGGFANGVTIRGVPVTMAHPGKVFWVNNSGVLAPSGIGASDSNDGTYQRPFLTLDYAIGRCLANRGDIVVLMPGHVETVTAAAGIVFDVAGVAVVGLGAGSKQPKITFTTAAAADVDITAANISFYNVNFEAAFADVTAMVDIDAVAGVSFENCQFTESGTNLNYVIAVDFATGASDAYFSNCRWTGNDAANDNCINMVALDKIVVKDSFMAFKTAQAVAAALINATGAVTNTLFKRLDMVSLIDGALFIISDQSTNNGVIAECYLSSLDIAGAVTTGINWTGAHVFECYVAGEGDSFGIVGGGTVYNNA